MGAAFVVVGLAFMAGLLVTAIPYAAYAMPLVGIGLAFASRRFWRMGPPWWVWLLAGVVALGASFYLDLRLPRPAVDDISRKAPAFDVVVEGRVVAEPRFTQSGKVRFNFAVERLTRGSGEFAQVETIGGTLYVNLPATQGEGLYPGQAVRIKGDLYIPRGASFQGGFDFQRYLNQQGIFAGLRGEEVFYDAPAEAGWGLWRIRKQIVDVHRQALGDQAGPLMSAMVIGARAVDVPSDLRAAFTRAGLAHTIAASGFHVSLLLGVMLALTAQLGTVAQVSAGLVALGVFVSMAGWIPSVGRAALMGLAGLAGLVTGRRTQPLMVLLLVAVVLLLWNPHWIWDLGFEFTFLATLGLIVHARPIAEALGWLPKAIADLAGVAIAAYLWTLPLQLYNFGLINTYAIPINVAATPLVTVITLGGLLSALAAVTYAPLGVWLSIPLGFPTRWLIALVNWANTLPLNALAVGRITTAQLVILYGLLALVVARPQWAKRWLVLFLFALGLVFIPLVGLQATRLQVAVLDAGRTPIMVIKDRWRTVLINSGDAQTVQFTLLPYLQIQGINRVDLGLALPGVPNAGWSEIQAKVPVARLISESPIVGVQTERWAGAITLGQVQIEALPTRPAVWQFQVGSERWLWLPAAVTQAGTGDNRFAQQDQLVAQGLPQADVLWWSGDPLGSRLLQAVRPYGLVASNFRLRFSDQKRLEEAKIPVWVTGQVGLIQWQPQRGFTAGRGEGGADLS